jgi:hypothetical protein
VWQLDYGAVSNLMRLKRPSCTIGRKSQPGKTGMLKMTLPLRYEFDAEPRGMFVLLLVRLRLDMQCTFKGDFRAGNRRPIEPLKEPRFWPGHKHKHLPAGQATVALRSSLTASYVTK